MACFLVCHVAPSHSEPPRTRSSSCRSDSHSPDNRPTERGLPTPVPKTDVHSRGAAEGQPRGGEMRARVGAHKAGSTCLSVHGSTHRRSTHARNALLHRTYTHGGAGAAAAPHSPEGPQQCWSWRPLTVLLQPLTLPHPTTTKSSRSRKLLYKPTGPDPPEGSGLPSPCIGVAWDRLETAEASGPCQCLKHAPGESLARTASWQPTGSPGRALGSQLLLQPLLALCFLPFIYNNTARTESSEGRSL